MNLPASPGQLRFFLLDGQDGGAARTLVKNITIEGRTDPDRLRRALHAVLAEHPALRTSLHLEGEGLVQHRHRVDEVPLTFAEAAGPDAVSLAERAAQTVPFRHGAGPLCAIRVLRGEERTHCLFSVHHAVFDDDSTAILFAALVAAYEADAPGIAADTEPAIAPVDAAEQARLRSYWAGQLAGAPGRTELPWAVEAGGHRRETRERSLPDEVSAALRERARETGASPFAQFLSAVAMVTSWYLDRDDVVFAVPVSGREATAEPHVDCLQNTVPVRISLAGTNTHTSADTDTATAVERTVDALLDALDHRELPFEDILDSAGVVRRPGHKPLAQILVTETAPVPERHAAGLSWRVSEAAPQEVEYDACLALCHRPDAGMRVELSYRSGGLSPVRAQHTVDHVVRLLGRLAEGPAEPLATLDLLGEAERRELAILDEALAAGSDGDGDGDRAHAAPGDPVTAPLPVPARILGHARRTPEAVAVTGGGQALTYAQLAHRSAAVAARLAGSGVGPGDRVGVCLARDPDLLAVLLGVWRAGALYVPLDPDYPAERLRYVIGDASLAAVIADRDVPLAAGPAPAVLELDALRRQWAVPDAPGTQGASGTSGTGDEPGSYDRAYLIYTSGSTGRPKGVVVGHDQLTALCDALDEVLVDAPVTVAGTSLSFDISALELFWPLTRGRTVLLTGHRQVSEEAIPEGALYQCTPTVARILTGDPRGRAALGRLGALLVGGEPLPSDLADDLATLVPGPVLNCYGPTETTVWSTVWRVVRGARIGIGRPLAGESCHVVDSLGRLLPPGCSGRLVITGAGVAEGYWRRSELTGERFAALPATGGRLGYDTGDLAVLEGPEGLRFLGRRDGQCKILGRRVELEEVEAVLRSAPGVTEAAVAPDAGSTHLVAFLVDSRDPQDFQGPPGGGRTHDDPPRHLTAERLAALRTHADSWLPQTMVPAVWYRVASLPQLPNGKLDRGALTRWAAVPRPSTATHPTEAPQTEAPAGSTYEQVRQVWELVLGRPVRSTDRDVTFFDLGGTSAALLRVLVALRAEHPLLTVGALFRHTTLRALADHLAGSGEARLPAQRPAATTATATATGTSAPPDAVRGRDRSRALGTWQARRRSAGPSTPSAGPSTTSAGPSTPSGTSTPSPTQK